MTLHRRALLFAAVVMGAGGSAVAQDRGRESLRGRRRGTQAGGGGRSDAPHDTISTGPDPLQAYDLYQASRADGPVLAFVHGGGWSRGDKSMVHALPEYAERHGLTFASIGYRLVPAVTPADQARDVAAAVAGLTQTHPGRPIYLIGHSAGAHLAALVGIDDTYLGERGLTLNGLAGVILLDGAGYDATQPRPPRRGRIGQIVDDMYREAFGDQAAALSPTLLVRPGLTYAPYLIFHVASRDDARDQSHQLARVLVEAGGQAEVVSAPDDSHRDINVEFGQPGDAEGERCARFILTGRL